MADSVRRDWGRSRKYQLRHAQKDTRFGPYPDRYWFLTVILGAFVNTGHTALNSFRRE